MFKSFSAESANDAWQQLAVAFEREKCNVSQMSRAGETRELLHVAVSITKPRERWVLSRTPPINLAFALAEIVWIVSGRNDAAFLTFFNSKLSRFSGDSATYHGAYGYRLRHHFGIDQLERAYESLKEKPQSRQVVLQIWDGRVDLPDSHGNERDADIPCNIVSMLKIRGGRLEWTQIMRSNDLFRGFPYNVVQFTALQEVLAGWLGVELGSYNHMSDSLHVYERDFHNIGAKDSCRAEANEDNLLFSKSESECHFSRIAGHIERIIDSDVGAEDLPEVAADADLPPPFRNILLVLSAEGARRRRCPATTLKLIGECSNSLYRHAYSRWLERVRFPGSLPVPI